MLKEKYPNEIKEYIEYEDGWRNITRKAEKELIEIYGGIVWITNYDELAVPFYQKLDSNIKGTTRNADLLMGIGETVGCGERHETDKELMESLEKHCVKPDEYEWYIEMKKYYPCQTSGFGMGVERLLNALESENIKLYDDDYLDCYIIPVSENEKEYALSLAETLRFLNMRVELDYNSKTIKSNLKQAEKLNASFAIIIGENEVKEGYMTIRNMATKEEEKVGNKNVIKYLTENITIFNEFVQGCECDCSCNCTCDEECDCTCQDENCTCECGCEGTCMCDENCECGCNCSDECECGCSDNCSCECDCKEEKDNSTENNDEHKCNCDEK